MLSEEMCFFKTPEGEGSTLLFTHIIDKVNQCEENREAPNPSA